ncbi:(E)-4-hydroxy-3-methylbut-2-enyl-diphosphate synthase [Melioribacter sp. OK-6-Me]|uniref:(E)-4-hydroxy-3-methylbut-2-enyl-diphosphate synthase n=1 Tax=unclassified Melioribacter TaxID=2627329 RepID=UPI003ED9851D
MDIKKYKYCVSTTRYKRFKTREVNIGGIPLGGDNPIRVQSMTTTNTMDTIATVNQSIRLINAGCEYVRITAPSINEARNLENIKKELHKRCYKVPLIADIHFTPNAAEVAARIVEKVRINPGNYADKKKFQTIEYTDKQYEEEIERIRERFVPLLKICKEYGTAIRIGTNHGSLSDRIMSRYGDTPLGMVESALEFVRICRDENFHDIVLSMKASNPQIMVQAYRLLVNKMEEEGYNYPLHLGVTEAGDGEDGRVKSAVGIGTLLEDGLGDTIRVSLTEEPENEIPVAITLAKRYENRSRHVSIPSIKKAVIDPFNYKRRETFAVSDFGENNVPKVIADFSYIDLKDESQLSAIGYTYNKITDKWNYSDQSADCIYLGKNIPSFNLPTNLKPILDYDKWIILNCKTEYFPYFSSTKEFVQSKSKSFIMNFVEINVNDLKNKSLEIIKNDPRITFVLTTSNLHGMAEQRRVFFHMIENDIKNPIVIRRSYDTSDTEKLMLYASTDFGALLIDGLGDGIWISSVDKNCDQKTTELINRISFGILQATRTRISKTEYIACPSCGRTLFDLVEVTNKIRKRTEHLKGVKIAIMGCIVNGPGEMADADYGYVGSGPDRITLYRGKEIVKKNIKSEYALDELIELIKEDGKWVEKD